MGPSCRQPCSKPRVSLRFRTIVNMTFLSASASKTSRPSSTIAHGRRLCRRAQGRQPTAAPHWRLGRRVTHGFHTMVPGDYGLNPHILDMRWALGGDALHMMSRPAPRAINGMLILARLARQSALTRRMAGRLGVPASVNGNQRFPVSAVTSTAERASTFGDRTQSAEL